eukprot:192134-Chlamydomonas_euryale.AAC.1
MRHIFLSLFICANWRMRPSTTLSRLTSSAAPSLTSHSCDRISAVVARLLASCSSSRRTQLFAASEILGQGSVLKSMWPRSTILKICSSVSPQNGGRPDSRMYRMTPSDHMSASCP